MCSVISGLVVYAIKDRVRAAIVDCVHFLRHGREEGGGTHCISALASACWSRCCLVGGLFRLSAALVGGFFRMGAVFLTCMVLRAFFWCRGLFPAHAQAEGEEDGGAEEEGAGDGGNNDEDWWDDVDLGFNNPFAPAPQDAPAPPPPPPAGDRGFEEVQLLPRGRE